MTIISSSSPLHYESPVKKKKLYNYKPIIHRVSCRAKEIKKTTKERREHISSMILQKNLVVTIHHIICPSAQ